MGDVFIRTAGNNGVQVNEYKGNYSINAASESQDGKIYPVWAKYKKNKNEYQEKDWPVKVQLGNREEAAATLKMIYAEIMGGKIEDVPF